MELMPRDFVYKAVNDAYIEHNVAKRVKEITECALSFAMMVGYIAENKYCFFGNINLSNDLPFSHPPHSTRQIAFTSFCSKPRKMLMARVGLGATHIPLVSENILFDDVRWARSNAISPATPAYALANLQAAYWNSIYESESHSIGADTTIVAPYFTFTGYRIELKNA